MSFRSTLVFFCGNLMLPGLPTAAGGDRHRACPKLSFNCAGRCLFTGRLYSGQDGYRGGYIDVLAYVLTGPCSNPGTCQTRRNRHSRFWQFDPKCSTQPLAAWPSAMRHRMHGLFRSAQVFFGRNNHNGTIPDRWGENWCGV